MVDDLHAALIAGPIPGPYVLVGHSMGGIEARLYAQRWPKEVVGMVLVDTSPAGEGLIDENQPGFDEVIGGESYAADMLHCAFLVANGPLDPSRPEYNGCSAAAALPSDTPAAFRTIWPQFFTAYYFADKVSLMSSLYTHRYDSVDHRRLGAMPLVVLSIENTWNNGTPAGARFNRSYSKVWIALQQAWRISPRVAYTGSSRTQVTIFSWISHKRSSTPWMRCSASLRRGASRNNQSGPLKNRRC